MKRGAKVAVCHDGKWGRRVQGEIIATRQGHHVQVRFPHPETGEPVEFWARKNRTIRRTIRRKGSCISTGKRYAYFSGWADIAWWYPWYAVHPWPAGEPADAAEAPQ